MLAFRAAAPPGGSDSGQKATLCGPPDTLTKRTVVPGVTVSTLGSNAAFLVPSPVMRTSIRGPAAAAAGAAPPDAGERIQLLDVRSAERVALGRAALGPGLEFHALPASRLYDLASLDPLELDRSHQVLVICGHGNSSARAAEFLRQRGFEARSVTGGMAAWEAVYLPRRLSPTRALEHVVQLDRVGKGALSYIL